MKLDITYRYEARWPARPQPSDSDAAFCRLCDGNRAFAALFDSTSKNADKSADKSADRAEMIVELDPRDVGLATGGGEAPRQRPFAAVLGCADARVPIEMIVGEGPNDLFVLRVAGNGLGAQVLGSLNYAIDHLRDSLRLIVVLGHGDSGQWRQPSIYSCSRPSTCRSRPNIRFEASSIISWASSMLRRSEY